MSSVISASHQPCEGCRHHSRCQLEKLGCEALLLHMRGASPERWKFAPRQPSAEALARALTPVKMKQARRAPAGELEGEW